MIIDELKLEVEIQNKKLNESMKVLFQEESFDLQMVDILSEMISIKFISQINYSNSSNSNELLNHAKNLNLLSNDQDILTFTQLEKIISRSIYNLFLINLSNDLNDIFIQTKISQNFNDYSSFFNNSPKPLLHHTTNIEIEVLKYIIASLNIEILNKAIK